MDKRLFNQTLDFLLGVILGGVATNLLVNISTSGGEDVNRILLCPVGDALCGSWHIFLYTIILCSLIALVVLIFNIILWRNILGKINITVPILYQSNDSFFAIDHNSQSATITIKNDNKNDDVSDFFIHPIQIKILNFQTNHNTIKDVEKDVFLIEENRIRDGGKITETLAEVFIDGEKQPATRFPMDKKHRFNSHFFPYEVTEKSSDDNLKSRGDLYGAIYDVVFEIRGNLGAGKLSKVYKGRIVQFNRVHRWEKKKYRNSFRWVTCPETYESSIQWVSLNEYSLKEFEKAEKERFKKLSVFTKGEILTKDDFLRYLFSKDN